MNQFIIKKTVNDLRNITAPEIADIQNGSYLGVTLLGYYNIGDTPSPINYYLSESTRDDDGGSIFSINGVKMEHIFQSTTDVKYFGAVMDGLTDDRPYVQNAINYAANNKILLTNRTGEILLNSYSPDINYSHHTGVLEVRSNLKFEVGRITIGDYFNGKGFLLLSTFNHVWPDQMTPVYDVEIFGGNFDLKGTTNRMASYVRRIVIQFGWGESARIYGNVFENGDLTNCIGAGISFQELREGVNDFKVYNNDFINLAVSDKSVNYDHTSVYIFGDDVEIYSNRFRAAFGSTINYVGCAIEQHGSNFWIRNNVCENYTRFAFLVAIPEERAITENVYVTDNIIKTANTAIWGYVYPGATNRNIIISGNNIECRNIGIESLYDGFQAIYIGENKGGKTENLSIVDNKFKSFSAADGTLVAGVYIDMETTNLNVERNTLLDVYRGLVIRSTADMPYPFRVQNGSFRNNNMIIKNAIFTVGDMLGVKGFYVGNNNVSLHPEAHGQWTISLQPDTPIQYCHFYPNTYTERYPSKEVRVTYNLTSMAGHGTNSVKSFIRRNIIIPSVTISAHQTSLIDVTQAFNDLIEPSVQMSNLINISDITYYYANNGLIPDKNIYVDSNNKFWLRITNNTNTTVNGIDLRYRGYLTKEVSYDY